ncbi:MAG: succinylglutamate desuccinylase [Nitrospirales bacterium]|nr:hypothetical protein [Nitrospirales bacterium]
MKDAHRLPTWEGPKPDEVGETVEDFLQKLGRPSLLWFPGKDSSRTRAFSTLLHGNESSGVRALHRWIKEGHEPAVNLLCFIGVVHAILTEPFFSTRSVPGWRDLNRCFRPPFEGPDGAIAESLLLEFRSVKPEALIDVHNTSGRSPAYGVTTRGGRQQEFLTSLFSDHLVVTDLQLGALMEATEHDWPTVTIECGGANNHLSHEVAYQGFARYASAESLQHATPGVTVVHHPLRVEIRPGSTIVYGTERRAGTDLCLPLDVDLFNFGILTFQDSLGWVGPKGLDVLYTKDAQGCDRSREIFSIHEQTLRLVKPSRIMMATTRQDIAQSDCLFYVLPVQ